METSAPAYAPARRLVLLASVFVVASCGLVYELLAGALSSYLLGNSVTQFSLVIGMFLFAMGIGSYLSRFVDRRLVAVFLAVEIAVGLLGGSSALLLFFAFAALDTYLPLLVILVLVVGALVGLEIPLLVRLVRRGHQLRQVLGEVLALDYLGALAASLLFPLVLLPWLGLVRTGFFFGLLNVAVAGLGLYWLRGELHRPRPLALATGAAAVLLLVGLFSGARATTWLEDQLYQDEILFARSSPYQRLVVTRWHDDIRLFIDGNIQFSSADEFRYHEALVHPALALAAPARRVLLLGAGDGLAAREVLKHDTVERVDIVDLDPLMTELFSTQPMLVRLNAGSLRHPAVHVTNADAQKFLEDSPARWDVIIMDLPDPNSESLGRLYTRSFFRLAARHLTRHGVLVTQATSPFYATAAFWCIVNTLAATTVGPEQTPLQVVPYHVDVPSFGDWGFVLAAPRRLEAGKLTFTIPTRFLDERVWPTLLVFGRDVGPRPTPVNRLDEQVLVQLYESGFSRYNQ